MLAGYIGWPNYRPKDGPERGADRAPQDRHDRRQPLEEGEGDKRVQFYADAEEVLAALPRRGVPMILRAPTKTEPAKPYSYSGMQKIVHQMRDRLRILPARSRWTPAATAA